MTHTVHPTTAKTLYEAIREVVQAHDGIEPKVVLTPVCNGCGLQFAFAKTDTGIYSCIRQEGQMADHVICWPTYEQAVAFVESGPDDQHKDTIRETLARVRDTETVNA